MCKKKKNNFNMRQCLGLYVLTCRLYRIIYHHRRFNFFFLYFKYVRRTLGILFSVGLLLWLLLLLLCFHWRYQMWKCVYIYIILCRKGKENECKMRRLRVNRRTINKKSNSHGKLICIRWRGIAQPGRYQFHSVQFCSACVLFFIFLSSSSFIFM